MKRINRLLFIIFMILIVSFIVSTDLLAHELLIKEVGEDYGIVKFDNGTRAMEVDVSLYNQNDEVIATVKTDLEGVFEFDKNIEAAKIISVDEYGHRAVWKREDKADDREVSRWSRALLGVSLLLAIGVGSKIIQSKT